jgi:alcohol oxidase
MKYHGSDGPVPVSDGTYRSKRVEDDWLQAAAKLGYPEYRDLQDLDSNNGFQRWLRYVSPEGRRSDAAHCYVHPLLQDGKHPNLHVLVQAKVVRVLFDENKRACGVEYTPNPHFQVQVGMTASPQQKFTVRARKTVVVSAGACGSPSILERSGLGPPEVLQKAGVSLVEELPGVGHGYQDHHLILYPFRTSLAPEDTIDALIYERIDPEQAATHPHLGWNSCDIAAKLRPNDEDVKALGPAFQAAWEKDFKNIPDRPLMLMAVLNGYDQPQWVSIGDWASIGELRS